MQNEKDYSSITLEEAILWTIKNCSHNDVCKRLRSRAVARRLLQELQLKGLHENPNSLQNRARNLPLPRLQD